MPSNLEIKIRISDPIAVRNNAAHLADSKPCLLNQIDYFFPVPVGRLKLRVETTTGPDANDRPQTRSELIAYDRADQAVARESDYLICPVGDADSLLATLGRSLGHGPVVKKSRELFLTGRTRIHLDQVEGLGDFLEIEVVMGPDEDAESGRTELDQILQALQVEDCPVQSVAYADLLSASGSLPV